MQTIFNNETKEYETTGPAGLVGFGETPSQAETSYLEQARVANSHRAKNRFDFELLPADPRTPEERARDEDIEDLQATLADLRASMRF